MDQSAVAHIERLLREETAGEFEIQGLLGRGGMAMVYLAREVHLARKVAIKVLPPELTFGHGVERFKREAKTAAALDHPNIIPVYRVGPSGKIFWYAMKFLEGRSLDELLKDRKRFSLPETIEILGQVADALDYAHEHQVVHRDVKPANVMLDSRNRVVVTDFGIAKALTEGGLTASGSVIGTPYFMSPEQGMGKPVTGRSDQYSVGVMAYRMLAGQVPFEGDSAIDILHKHCVTPAPALEGVQPGLPDYAYRAIHKALAKDPERRFPTVRAFVEALQSRTGDTPDTDELTDLATVVVPGLSTRSRAMPGPAEAAAPEAAGRPRAVLPPRPRPGTTKGRTGLIAGVAVAVVAVVAVGGMLVKGGSSDPPTAVDSAVAPTPPPAPVPTTATVTVTNLPAGAEVFVDGAPRSGPSFTLGSGPHAIRVTAAGFEPMEVTVPVVAGRDTSIAYHAQRVVVAQTPTPRQQPPPRQPPPRPSTPSTGLLQIRIRPAATVFVDGVSKGERGSFEESLTVGQHVLRIERDGYVPVDTTITIRAGQPFRSTFSLQQR
jgi:serine/threonine-protein kinase